MPPLHDGVLTKGCEGAIRLMTASPESSPPPIGEKRRSQRMRCLREAHCVFNKGYSDLTVLVRNMSTTGAKLTGDELICLPDEFELQMTNAHGALTARRVKRVWTRNDSMGVQFLESERELPFAPPDAAAAGR